MATTLLTSTSTYQNWFTVAHIIWFTFMAAIFIFGIKMPRLIKSVSKSIEEAKTHDGRLHEREEYP